MHTDAAVFVQGYPFDSRNQGVALGKIKIRHTAYGVSLSRNDRKTAGLLLCPLREAVSCWIFGVSSFLCKFFRKNFMGRGNWLL